MKRALFTAAVTSATVLGGAAACDDASAPGDAQLAMTFSVPSSTTFGPGDVVVQVSDDDEVIIVRGSQRLRLDRVQVTASRIDLERVDEIDNEDTDLDTDQGEDSDIDTDSDQRDNIRFRGPVTFDLPLTGGLTSAFRAEIPVGIYDEAKFRVETVRIIGAFDDDRDGTFETVEEFDVTVPVREKFEVELDEPLVIDQTTDLSSLTVRLNPPLWFRNRDGSLFNPRRLVNDNQLRVRFRQLVRSTLRAFEDGNRNGEDDRDTDGDR
jgi:hypothetical protein